MGTLAFDEQQVHQLGQNLFVHRLDAALCREDAVWAAQLLQRLPVIGARAHGSVQGEPVDVGAQRLLELRLPGHGALNRQHLLASTRAEGDAVGARRRLQRPEYARLVRIAVAVAVGLGCL